MRKTKRVFLAVGCLLIMVPACSSAGNHERAYFTTQGTSYLVEMKGTRRLMAHDPISAIRGKTYEETLTIEIPRIEGVNEGSEISVAPDRLPYGGRVVISRSQWGAAAVPDRLGRSIFAQSHGARGSNAIRSVATRRGNHLAVTTPGIERPG